MTCIRRSLESNNFMEDESKHRTYSITKQQYAKPRYSSHDKKYDYQSELNQSKEINNQTPSSSFHKTKYQNGVLADQQYSTLSHAKLKRVNKNYTNGLGNNNFAQLNLIERKTRQPESYLLQNRENRDFCNQNMREDYRDRLQQQSTYNSKQNYQNKALLRRSREANDKSYSKKIYEEDTILSSFERINEQKMLEKVGRINKLNSEINGRLQRILAKITSNQ